MIVRDMGCLKLAASCGALLLALGVAPSAKASYVLTIVQSGSNVMANGSGTINTAALTNGGSATDAAQVWPAIGAASVGASGPVTLFTGVTGPATFGAGSQTIATTGTGSVVSILSNLGGPQSLYTPSGYVSGSALSGTGTWNNQTIAGLGLTAGTYTWTWGTGANADSFVLTIGTVPPGTPAPATLYLVLAGILCLGLYTISRSRRTA